MYVDGTLDMVDNKVVSDNKKLLTDYVLPKPKEYNSGQEFIKQRMIQERIKKQEKPTPQQSLKFN